MVSSTIFLHQKDLQKSVKSATMPYTRRLWTEHQRDIKRHEYGTDVLGKRYGRSIVHLVKRKWLVQQVEHLLSTHVCLDQLAQLLYYISTYILSCASVDRRTYEQACSFSGLQEPASSMGSQLLSLSPCCVLASFHVSDVQLFAHGCTVKAMFSF